jgi:hypothetical protein
LKNYIFFLLLKSVPFLIGTQQVQNILEGSKYLALFIKIVNPERLRCLLRVIHEVRVVLCGAALEHIAPLV